MSIQISDCTVRDGGYLGDKNFPPEFVRGVMAGLVQAGIEYIETGFLQDTVNGETLVYHNAQQARRFLPADCGRSEFAGFCDNSRYSNDALEPCDGTSFKSLRISFAKHEWRSALQFCTAAKEKGYHVFVQPMDANGYTSEERAELIAAVNALGPGVFSIVDTFGLMHLDDLCRVFREIDALLDKSIKIGLHSHNNLNLSCALAEQLITMAVESERSVVVDGSLFGMARGAGNACTETIAEFLNTHYGAHYDMAALFDTIQTYILPLRNKVSWGYDMPMFICGARGAHVDNIACLTKNGVQAYREMYKVLGMLGPEERKRYGANYSKTDFTKLEAVLAAYKANENEDKNK